MRPSARLFGREGVYGDLRARFEGESGLILVSGEAGVGKTRLIQEVAASLRPDQSIVWGRPEQVSRPGPYALVLDLLEDVIDRIRGGAKSESLRDIGRRLANVNSDRDPELPLRRLGAEVRGAIAELGSHPVAVLEDLHQADEASLSVVLILARSAGDDGHLIVGTYRDDEVRGNLGLERFLDVVARERLAHEVKVLPLDDRASEEFAKVLVGPSADARLVRKLLELGEGIPFYLEELADSVGPDVQRMPQKVSRSTSLRVERLSPSERLVLQAAAMHAGPIDTEVLEEALGVSRRSITRALTEGIRVGVLEERDERIVFRHALVREALADNMSSLEKRELHQQLASAIERLYPDDLKEHAPSLAVHWYEARNREKSLEFGLIAGERALSLAALPDAQRAFELALASSPTRAPSALALSGLAEVARRESDLDEARNLFDRATERYQAEGLVDDAAHASAEAAWMTWLGGRDASVLERIDDALQMVTLSNDSLRAGLLSRKAKVLIAFGRVDDAESALNTALSAAGQSGERAIEADVLEALALLMYMRNDSARYHEYSKAACAKALLSENAEVIGRTHNNRALFLILHDDIAEGLACLQIARERLERSFGTSGLAIIRVTEAIARWRLGQPVLAEESISKSALSLALFRGWVRIVRAWATAHLGDVARAEQISSSAWEDIGKNASDLADGIQTETEGEAALCSLLLTVELQRPEGTALGRAVCEFYDQREEAVLAASLASRCAAVSGLAKEADEFAERARNLLDVVSSPYLRAHIAESKAGVHILEGSFRDAEDGFKEAHSIFASFGNLVDAGRCLRRLAETTLSIDPSDDSKAAAIQVLRDSLEIANKAGSALEVARVEAKLRELGVRPRAGRPRKDRTAEESNSLSSREEQVAALVSAGLTNHEIAARLYLSERTVQDHITHALRKLRLPGRAALAAWAVRNHRI